MSSAPIATLAPAIDLRARPNRSAFLELLARELTRRGLRRPAVAAHRRAVGAFLTAFGGAPHEATPAAVEQYLRAARAVGTRPMLVEAQRRSIALAFDELSGHPIACSAPAPAPSAEALFAELSEGVGLDPEEIAGLTWAAVDLGGAFVRLEGRSGRPQRVALTPRAAELLGRHPRAGGYVFSDGGGRGPGVAPRKLRPALGPPLGPVAGPTALGRRGSRPEAEARAGRDSRVERPAS